MEVVRKKLRDGFGGLPLISGIFHAFITRNGFISWVEPGKPLNMPIYIRLEPNVFSFVLCK